MANVEFPGNVIPAPGFTRGAFTYDQEIMSSMAAGYTQRGIQLAAGQGILPAGTVMGRVTASKLWVVYNNGAGDGREVARGVLRNAVNTGTDVNGQKFRGNLVTTGVLKNSLVSGADSAAITDLGARVDTVLDTFTF